MEADCQWKNLVWRLSPSRSLGREINEQDRSSIESEDKSRRSDRYFGVFYHNSRNCTNGNAYCKIHTIMWLGRILGPINSFFNTPFSLLMCHMRMAHGAWPSQSLGMLQQKNAKYILYFKLLMGGVCKEVHLPKSLRGGSDLMHIHVSLLVSIRTIG